MLPIKETLLIKENGCMIWNIQTIGTTNGMVGQ